MRRPKLTLVAAALAVFFATASAAQEAQNAYRRPLKPKGLNARAVVLPPRKIGNMDLRAANTLAVEIQVEVQDYLPRALEPVLVVDDKPAKARSRVVKVEGDTTTLGFVVDQPDVLKDGSKLSVQMGDEEQTRARIPGEIRFDRIKPLDKEEADRMDMPTLPVWVKSKPKP